MQNDEVKRIKARILKAQRRIERGYTPPPDYRGESERDRMVRLEWRLKEIEAANKLDAEAKAEGEK